LHFRSKAKTIDLRGTKFSLPKPGRANKYEGDILLREDQLLMGAWRQKVIKGSKAVSSMFGSDISDTVHQMITSMDGTEKQKINQGPDWQNKTYEKVINEDFFF